MFDRFLTVSRGREWWEYKLAPIFAAFYATALTLRVPVSSACGPPRSRLLAARPRRART